MGALILTVHSIVAVSIVAVVLLQQGKGADVGSSFGGGASQTIFGAPGGGNVLSHLTAGLVALFFFSSFALAMYAGRESDRELQVEIPAELRQQAEEALPEEEGFFDEETEADDEDFPTPFSE